MSKIIPIALANHLAQPVTQLAFLWRVTRTDGQVFGFTSHDTDIVFDGLTYFTRSGFDASQITTSSDLSVDSMKVAGFFNHDSITDRDMLNRVWDYAEVQLDKVQWSNPSGGVEKIRLGFLGEISTTKHGFQTELLGLMQKLQQPMGRVYVAACDANFGDARCGINIAAFTVTSTVTAVGGGGYTFTDSARTEAADWFKGGKLLWLGGLNEGASIEIKSYSAGVFELQEAARSLISAGDAYSVHAGCNKIRDTDCKLKFNNVINHRGCPSKPTQDKLQSGK